MGEGAFLVASYTTVSNSTFQKADLACHKCKKGFKQNEDSSSKIILASMLITILTKDTKQIFKKYNC